MKSASDTAVRLDLNNPIFQRELFGLQKHERHSALETLQKLTRMTWDQIYRDRGLKWGKIARGTLAPGANAIYSLRLTQSRRATAYRDGQFMRFVSIPPDHDATYGKK
jgi:hypothetical protein